MPEVKTLPIDVAGRERPTASVLLISFNQQATIRAAIEGALAQTYTPLEVVISDDASSDDTWAEIVRAMRLYNGPHRVILNRNASNLGIGAHLSRLVGLSSGEMLFVAAGDDVSLPHRCERVMNAWLAGDKKIDLIAGRLIDVDAAGVAHGEIAPSDLAQYRTLAHWAANPPHVVGAAQAWTRRVFDRFGGLPVGVVAEDQIMAFRAIACGGAITLPEALVQYRRGGISGRVRNLRGADVVGRILSDNRHALVESEQLMRDALRVDASADVQAYLDAMRARAQFIAELFGQTTFATRCLVAWRSTEVPLTLRARLWCYSAAPWILFPVFALKRLAARLRQVGEVEPR